MFRKIAPYLLLVVLAAGAGCATAELMPAPGSQHTAPAAPTAPAPDRSGEPVARPGMPVPATGAPSSASQPQLGALAPAAALSDTEGGDAGLVTAPAPQVTPLPGGAAPAPTPEAPRPVDAQPGPVCLVAACPPIADETGYGPACAATQLPEETTGRATD